MIRDGGVRLVHCERRPGDLCAVHPPERDEMAGIRYGGGHQYRPAFCLGVRGRDHAAQ